MTNDTPTYEERLTRLEVQIAGFIANQATMLQVLSQAADVQSTVSDVPARQLLELSVVLAAAVQALCAEGGVDAQRVADAAEAAMAARSSESQRAVQMHALWFVEALRSSDGGQLRS